MRVKTGVTRRQNHKRLHKATKGFRMSKHKLVKVSKEALLHAGQYAFNSRRKKKGAFREVWIQRINAALSEHDISYSTFINLITKEHVGINRKMLAELAINDPEVFKQVVAEVKSSKVTEKAA